MEAAQKAGFPSEERFLIDNFTYVNSVVVARMFQHVQNTDFLGITVRTYKSRINCILSISTVLQGHVVHFNEQGTRRLDTLDAYQYRPGEEGTCMQLLCCSTITKSP